MRKATCPHCQESFTEADAGWDVAADTGTCPACGKLLDTVAESGAEAMAASDERVKSGARARRLAALLLGLISLSAALYFWSFWLGLFGVLNLGFAVVYSSRDEARELHKAPTDLAPFSDDKRED